MPQGMGFQQVAAPRLSKVSDVLLLVGISVGFAMSGFMLLMMSVELLVFRQIMRDTSAPFGFFQWFPLVFIGGSVVALVGATIGIPARNRLKRSVGQDGRGLAIASGVIMIVGMNMIAGVLMIVGGVLADPQKP